MSKLPEQDGFCVLPWLSICATVEGVWSRCCIDRSVYSGEKTSAGGKLAEDALGCSRQSSFAKANPEHVLSLKQAFNSYNLRRTRLAMLRGERVPACDDCRRREQMGALSYRVNMNAQFAHLDWDERLRSTDASGTVPNDPLYLDLRLGNFCNLRCTMCSWPTSSAHGDSKAARLEPYGEDFFDEFTAMASHVERIYFAGGEPLLQRGHRRALEVLLANGRAPLIELVYNTNLTVLPKWCFDAWSAFKSVDLGVSCDGVGGLFESIRCGARWSRLVQNLNRLRDTDVKIRLAVTVQRANARGITPLIAWANANGYAIDLSNVLLFPEDMSLVNEHMDVLHVLLDELAKAIVSCREIEREQAAQEAERLIRVVEGIIVQRAAS